jgi:hypothetical protein
MTRQRNMAAMAGGALSVGVLLYVLDRRHDHVYFLSGWLPPNNSPAGFFGSVGDFLPTLIHVYAFILLTVIVAAPPVTKVIHVCLAWFTLDSLLEIGQIDPVARWIAAHTADRFAGVPFLENTPRYFLYGTFDVRDLLSIAAGTVAAYATVYMSRGDCRIDKKQ